MAILGSSACISRFKTFIKRIVGLEKRGFNGRTSGFTLIELLVSIAIISIMLSITVVSAPANRREFLLSTSQEQLRTLIVRSRALSINSVVTGGQVLTGEQCGYGTHVDKTLGTAFIYYSCGSKTFDPASTELTGTLNQMYLNKSLKFSASASEDVFFLPPDPTVYIGGTTSTASTTILIETSSGEARGVEVNSAGLIDLTM